MHIKPSNSDHMRVIALHILDLIENSVRAESGQVHLILKDSKDKKTFILKDNGKGMNEEELKTVLDPFYTTKKKKKIGLGIPLTRQSILQCNGIFNIESKKGTGTTITLTYPKKNIDCPPTGDILRTISTSIIAHPTIDFLLSFQEEENILVDTTFLNLEERKALKIKDLYEYISEAFVEIDWNGF